MIPGLCNRKVPIHHDWELHRERNIVKRGSGWFKQCRRLATRYKKTTSCYLGAHNVRRRSPSAAKPPNH